MNLGCGTLIMLFLMIAAAGKFLPHADKVEGTATPAKSGARPASAQGRLAPSEASAGKNHPAMPSPASKAQSEASTPEMLEPQAVLAHIKGLVSHWVEANTDSRSVEAGSVNKESTTLTRALESGFDTLGKFAKEGLEGAGGVRSAVPIKAPPMKSGLSANAESGKVETHRPALSAGLGQEAVASGSKGVVPGKDKVFNSPWNQSVEQVERYLKHHVHDAASLEILDWGLVTTSPKGYEVSCTYKSKNVLGKWATRTSVFVLNSDGVVTDIKDPVPQVAAPPKVSAGHPNGPVGQGRQSPRRADHR